MKISSNQLFEFEIDYRACRSCQATVNQKDFGLEHYLGSGQSLRLCGACGLAYLGPDFTDESLEVFYSKYYRAYFPQAVLRSSDTSSSLAQFFRRVACARAEYVSTRIARDAKVLEVGSGYGAFLGQLSKLRPDLQIFATEIDIKSRNVLLDGANVHFINEASDAAPFGAIMMFHVLEHLKDPVSSIRECSKLLSQSGKLFIEVPDVNSDWRGWEYVHPAHLSYFSSESLCKAIAMAGAESAFVGSHPIGSGFEGTLWAEISGWNGKNAFVPAQVVEIAELSEHIGKYTWTWKRAVRRIAKYAVLNTLGPRGLRYFMRYRALS